MPAWSRDDDTIVRAKTGDNAAWRELYEAHHGRLKVWLRSRPCHDVIAAHDDIAADAWLTAAQKIADFAGTSSDFAGWLFSIARNITMNDRRRDARRATSPYAVGDDASWGTVADISATVAGNDWVSRLLAQLPPREAEVVACIDVVGLDISATSRALGISATAVRVSHYRALTRLRKLNQSGVAPTARVVADRAPGSSG